VTEGAVVEESNFMLENTIQKYFDAWERQDTTALKDVFTPDARYIVHPFGVEQHIGFDAIKEYWSLNSVGRQLHPKPKILSKLIGSDIAFVEWGVTYKDKLTHRDRELRGIMVLQFKNGLIAELREHYDSLKEPGFELPEVEIEAEEEKEKEDASGDSATAKTVSLTIGGLTVGLILGVGGSTLLPSQNACVAPIAQVATDTPPPVVTTSVSKNSEQKPAEVQQVVPAASLSSGSSTDSTGIR